MNRTFHSRVGAGYWLLMAATAFLVFDFFWFHELLLTLLLAIVMIFEIEMLIHTQYVVTAEGNLQIETGRFVRKATIPLEKIMLIQHVKSWGIAPALSPVRLKISYQTEKGKASVLVSPKGEDDFIRCLMKRNQAIRVE